jgi:hypothetical protein
MWFVTNSNNQQIGPIDERDIAAGLAQGHFNAQTLVWREGMGAWLPLGNSELAKYLPRTPAQVGNNFALRARTTPNVTSGQRIIGAITLIFGSLATVGFFGRHSELTSGLFIALVIALIMVVLGAHYCFNRSVKMLMLSLGLLAFVCFVEWMPETNTPKSTAPEAAKLPEELERQLGPYYANEFAKLQAEKNLAEQYFQEPSNSNKQGAQFAHEYLSSMLAKCNEGYVSFKRTGEELTVWQWRDLELLGWNAPVPEEERERMQYGHSGLFSIDPALLDEQARINDVTDVAGFSGVYYGSKYSMFRYRSIGPRPSPWSMWFTRAQSADKGGPPMFAFTVAKVHGKWTGNYHLPINTTNSPPAVFKTDYIDSAQIADVVARSTEAAKFLKAERCEAMSDSNATEATVVHETTALRSEAIALNSNSSDTIDNCNASDKRTPIQVWKPKFISNYLTSLPDYKDGELVHVEFASDATNDCFGQEMNSFSYPSQTESYGGTEVNFKGNASVRGKVCLFEGLYVNEHVEGMHQGWLATLFQAASPKAANSSTHCLRASNESRSTALAGWAEAMATNQLCKSDRFNFAAQFFPNKIIIVGEKYNFTLKPQNSAAQLIGSEPEFSSGEKSTFEDAFQPMKNYQIAFEEPSAKVISGRVSFEKYVDNRWVPQGANLIFACQ